MPPVTNVLLSLAYCVLIVLQLSFTKVLFRRRTTKINNHYKRLIEGNSEFQQSVNHQSTAETASPIKYRQSQDQPIQQPGIGKFLLYYLRHHPFSRFQYPEFPYRVYQMLIPALVLNIAITDSSISKSAYAIPVGLVIHILVVFALRIGGNYVDRVSKQRIRQKILQNQSFRVNYLREEQPVGTEMITSLHLQLYPAELVSCLFSTLALCWMGVRFCLILDHKVPVLHELQMLGIGLGCDLFVARPLVLSIAGLISYNNFMKDKETYLREHSSRLKSIIRYTNPQPVELKTHKSGMKEARQNSIQNQETVKEDNVMEFTIQQNTQDQMNWINNPRLVNLQSHSESQSDHQTLKEQLARQAHVQQKQNESGQEHPHISAIMITTEAGPDATESVVDNIDSSEPSNEQTPDRVDKSEPESQTVKKPQVQFKCVHIPASEIVCIDEFRIANFEGATTNNNSLKKYHDKQDKEPTRQNLEIPYKDEECSEGIDENALANQPLKNLQPLHSQVFQINTKKSISGGIQSHRLIGSIIEEDSQNSGVQTRRPDRSQKPKQKTNSRNSRNGSSTPSLYLLSEPRKASVQPRKVHLVYSREEAESHRQGGEAGDNFMNTGRENRLMMKKNNEFVEKRCASQQDRIHIEDANKIGLKDEFLPTQEIGQKENIAPNQYSKPSEIFSLLKPLELLQVREAQLCHDEQQPGSFSDCDKPDQQKKKRKRRTLGSNQRRSMKDQLRNSKSPYLQFLPKMLHKEELQRNLSAIDNHQHMRAAHANKELPSGGKKAGGPRKFPNMELQIIKKSIPTDIETVYT